MIRVTFISAVVWLALALLPRPMATQQTRNPHGSLDLPCADCHQADGWRPVRISPRFDHDRQGFALEGAHRSAPCTTCHQSLTFADTPRDCVGCHQDVHLGELGLTCSRCHQSRSFTDPADQIRSHQQSRFPLDGAHVALACRECHEPAPAGGLTWRDRPSECVACHLPAFQSTDSPDHEGAGFSRDCLACHRRSTWGGVRFDHAATRFPLSGAHLATSCGDCHVNGQWQGLPVQCLSCHQADYDGVTVPNHQTLAFSTDCTVCHTTATWAGATFDHAATQFPLTGAHVGTPCAQCHGDGVYQGKSTTCVSCHQAEYDATVDPDHGVARFSTTCTTCHTTSAWAGARFAHDADFFPIYSGKHAGRWTSCASCHTSSTSYAVFSCLTCHEHNQIKMDDTHKERTGYRYESAACLSCHPRGDT